MQPLFAKQQEAKLDQRAKKSNKDVAFKIIEAAQLPSVPYSPHRRRILLMGFLASLGLGLIAVISVEQMDTSFDTIEEFQRFTTLPVLSAVSTIPGRAREISPVKKVGASSQWAASELESDGFTPGQRQDFQKRRLAVIGDPQSPASEQYGILGLKIQQWMNQSGGRVLLVTSAGGGEGKSVTAVNLSLSLASSIEGRVLLLDGDLRRPQVHTHLGLNPAKGFSDLLRRPDGDVNSYVSKFQNLYVIAGGAEPVNPVGLLASRRVGEILARLRNEFQFVVLDSPPIVPIADSHILAGLADGVLIVVRARRTPRELFRRAIESLGASNVLGVVLNDVEYGDMPAADPGSLPRGGVDGARRRPVLRGPWRKQFWGAHCYSVLRVSLSCQQSRPVHRHCKVTAFFDQRLRICGIRVHGIRITVLRFSSSGYQCRTCPGRRVACRSRAGDAAATAAVSSHSQEVRGWNSHCRHRRVGGEAISSFGKWQKRLERKRAPHG